MPWEIPVVNGDEYYTLEKDCEIIAQHITRPMKVWCPFDTEDSYFPKVLKNHGHNVTFTSTDFFTTEPPEGCEAIISNPPFSKKTEVLKRCKDLNIKFVLILPWLYLGDGVPLDYGNQLMLFRKRMYFNLPDEKLWGRSNELTKPRTNCFVLSNGLLTNNLIIIH